MISVVMAHYRREELLYRALWAYRHLHSPEELSNVEFVIVDDDGGRSDLFWKVIKLHRRGLNITAAAMDDKTTNACKPLNFGIKLAIGKTLVLTNTENIPAVPGLLTCMKDELVDEIKRYLSCGCYSLPQFITQKFGKVKWEDREEAIKAIHKLKPRENRMAASGQEGWYNHSRFRPAHLYFLVAMPMITMRALGGFDESYARGYGYEDSDLVERIRRAHIEIITEDKLFCYHQYHFNSEFRMSDKRKSGYCKNGLIFKQNRASGQTVRNKRAGWGKPEGKVRVERWHE